ncbi:MAG TPA: QacE family quaternary ammonium compound efflux SMR transporter [Corynebacteriales bacterium]|nr:QacE family quaternary ammonium compound efflux SMR transporter [Mycobacteriales bacterium]
MAWVILVVSGALEAVWAGALERMDGFRKKLPILAFVVGLFLSMGGLAIAMRDLPAGTAYAAWVGVGAGTTVLWSWATGIEKMNATRLALLVALIACIVGLRVVA